MTFKGSGEFPSFQQYNLGIGKVEGKVEVVGMKGMGSEWSCKPANSTHVTPSDSGRHRLLPNIKMAGSDWKWR